MTQQKYMCKIKTTLEIYMQDKNNTNKYKSYPLVDNRPEKVTGQICGGNTSGSLAGLLSLWLASFNTSSVFTVKHERVSALSWIPLISIIYINWSLILLLGAK